MKMSNIDVGARTIEINKAEYFIRGLGFVESVEDIEDSVVAVNDNVPIYVKDVAHVSLGPALRRGALDKDGAEAVGGVASSATASTPWQPSRMSSRKSTRSLRGCRPRRWSITAK